MMKSQARLRLRQPAPPEQVMPVVNGKPFRCLCGANVFTKRRAVAHWGVVYQCNGCGAEYA